MVSGGDISSLPENLTREVRLGRGTTLEGRARAFKFAYTLGPISAVLGSLGTQLVLNRGVASLSHPYDFALLYLLGVPCIGGVAFLSSYYKLVPVEEENRQSLLGYLSASIKSYAGVRTLVLLWLAYLLWFSTLLAMPNLSLYTKEAIGREPKELSGLIMALRFGFKSLGGFVLAVVTARWGIRAPLTTTVLLVGGACLWAWAAPGYLYLLAFGLMGAGELGRAYFPNYVIAISSAATGTRNLALLSLVTPLSSVVPILHGSLTDLFGFSASFGLGVATAILSLCLVLRLPSGPSPSPGLIQNTICIQR